MDPLPTLDVLLNDATTGKDRLTRAVESAIAAAEAELTAIEAYEAATSPESIYQFDRSVAAAVRGLFEGWLAMADALEVRLPTVVARAGQVRGGDLLNRRIARTRFRLSESLDDQERSARDALEGRGYTLEEVRRELRLPAKV